MDPRPFGQSKMKRRRGGRGGYLEGYEERDVGVGGVRFMMRW